MPSWARSRGGPPRPPGSAPPRRAGWPPPRRGRRWRWRRRRRPVRGRPPARGAHRPPPADSRSRSSSTESKVAVATVSSPRRRSARPPRRDRAVAPRLGRGPHRRRSRRRPAARAGPTASVAPRNQARASSRAAAARPSRRCRPRCPTAPPPAGRCPVRGATIPTPRAGGRPRGAPTGRCAGSWRARGRSRCPGDRRSTRPAGRGCGRRRPTRLPAERRHRTGRRAVGLEDRPGSPVQGPGHLLAGLEGEGLEEVGAEHLVVPVRASVVLHEGEQASALELVEVLGAPVASSSSSHRERRELVEHRGAEEEAAKVGRDHREHVRREVLPGEPDPQPGTGQHAPRSRRGPALGGEVEHLQAGRPPGGALGELGELVGMEPHAVAVAEQLLDLPGPNRSSVRVELDDGALEAAPVQLGPGRAAGRRRRIERARGR